MIVVVYVGDGEAVVAPPAALSVDADCRRDMLLLLFSKVLLLLLLPLLRPPCCRPNCIPVL